MTIWFPQTNDRVESNFGCYDLVIRLFEGISLEAASEMAQHTRMRYLCMVIRLTSLMMTDRRVKANLIGQSCEELHTEPEPKGCVQGLPKPLQQPLVEMARTSREKALSWERLDQRVNKLSTTR